MLLAGGGGLDVGGGLSSRIGRRHIGGIDHDRMKSVQKECGNHLSSGGGKSKSQGWLHYDQVIRGRKSRT